MHSSQRFNEPPLGVTPISATVRRVDNDGSSTYVNAQGRVLGGRDFTPEELRAIAADLERARRI